MLMLLLTLNSTLWLIVGILVLLGTSNGLAQQMPVAAMSKIKQEEHLAVAHSATLVTVIRAVAAPTGVALLSNLVQTLSQQNVPQLAAQGLTGTLLARQSSLLAMHSAFLVSTLLLLAALGAMICVPRWQKHQHEQPQEQPASPESDVSQLSLHS